jgi:hypothetical protein
MHPYWDESTTVDADMGRIRTVAIAAILVGVATLAAIVWLACS